MKLYIQANSELAAVIAEAISDLGHEVVAEHDAKKADVFVKVELDETCKELVVTRKNIAGFLP